MNQRILNLITYYREYRGDPAWEAYLTEQHTQRITGIWQGDYKGVPIDEWNVVIDGSKVVIYDAKEMHGTQVYLIPARDEIYDSPIKYDEPKVPVPDFMPLLARPADEDEQANGFMRPCDVCDGKGAMLDPFDSYIRSCDVCNGTGIYTPIGERETEEAS